MFTNEDFKKVLNNLKMFQYKASFNNVKEETAMVAKQLIQNTIAHTAVLALKEEPITELEIQEYYTENDEVLFQLRRFLKKNIIEHKLAGTTEVELYHDIVNKLVILGQQHLTVKMNKNDVEEFCKNLAYYVVEDIYQEMIIPRYMLGNETLVNSFYQMHEDFLVQEGMTTKAAYCVILGKKLEADKKIVLNIISNPIDIKDMPKIKETLYKNSLQYQITL